MVLAAVTELLEAAAPEAAWEGEGGGDPRGEGEGEGEPRPSFSPADTLSLREESVA